MAHAATCVSLAAWPQLSVLPGHDAQHYKMAEACNWITTNTLNVVASWLWVLFLLVTYKRVSLHFLLWLHDCIWYRSVILDNAYRVDGTAIHSRWYSIGKGAES